MTTTRVPCVTHEAGANARPRKIRAARPPLTERGRVFALGGTLSHELFNRGALTFDFSAMKLVFDPAR